MAKVWDAVRERLESEIRYWDQRTEEIKAQEIKGKKPRLNSGKARSRADELQARLTRRRLDLAQEDDLHNSPPTIIAAAVVVPQGLLDKLAGRSADTSVDPAIEGRDRPPSRSSGDEGRAEAGPRSPRNSTTPTPATTSCQPTQQPASATSSRSRVTCPKPSRSASAADR